MESGLLDSPSCNAATTFIVCINDEGYDIDEGEVDRNGHEKIGSREEDLGWGVNEGRGDGKQS